MGGEVKIPVQVAVRIRHLNDKESGEGCQAVLEQVEGEPQVSDKNYLKSCINHIVQVFVSNTEPVRSFTYDYAYGPDSSNEELYEGAVKRIVSQLFSGYNVTVLAYGQTGSGKTHSMGTAYK